MIVRDEYTNQCKNFFIKICCFLVFTTGTAYSKARVADETQPEAQTTPIQVKFSKPKKKWTFVVYMAADNNLHPFASRNLAQMKQIGSSENLNILVHLDIHLPGHEKTTKHLYVERDRILQIGPDYCMDSGDPETLITVLEWAIQDFPSEHLAFVFWNHGSGDLNPRLRKTINPANLFRYNSEKNLIELDRSIGFMDFIETLNAVQEQKRGICFDETYGTYLDDYKLMEALNYLKKHDKKIDVAIFDACLMAGTGTAYIMSQFADYMVASEEVVLGPGYNYNDVLTPLAHYGSNPRDFAEHLVSCYETTYGKITNDYTHSAIDLAKFKELNDNINMLSELLIDALDKQKNHSVKKALKKSRNKQYCVCFDEPTYIDLGNFYINLLDNLNAMQFIGNNTSTKKALRLILEEGLLLLRETIMKNTAGRNLAGAMGISIYFPERRIFNQNHQSYYSTEFARNNAWASFLGEYLSV